MLRRAGVLRGALRESPPLLATGVVTSWNAALGHGFVIPLRPESKRPLSSPHDQHATQEENKVLADLKHTRSTRYDGARLGDETPTALREPDYVFNEAMSNMYGSQGQPNRWFGEKPGNKWNERLNVRKDGWPNSIPGGGFALGGMLSDRSRDSFRSSQIFIHRKVSFGADWRDWEYDLKEGDEVVFDVKSSRNGKLTAINLRGEAVAGRRKERSGGDAARPGGGAPGAGAAAGDAAGPLTGPLGGGADPPALTDPGVASKGSGTARAAVLPGTMSVSASEGTAVRYAHLRALVGRNTQKLDWGAELEGRAAHGPLEHGAAEGEHHPHTPTETAGVFAGMVPTAANAADYRITRYETIHQKVSPDTFREVHSPQPWLGTNP